SLRVPARLSALNLSLDSAPVEAELARQPADRPAVLVQGVQLHPDRSRLHRASDAAAGGAPTSLAYRRPADHLSGPVPASGLSPFRDTLSALFVTASSRRRPRRRRTGCAPVLLSPACLSIEPSPSAYPHQHPPIYLARRHRCDRATSGAAWWPSVAR